MIVQGRHDSCTPPRAAWALKKAWPEVELQIVPDGGHLFNEPGILDGLIRATDRFAQTTSARERVQGSAMAEEKTPLRRVVMASLIGTTIEWYDFFLYGSAAALVFNKLFFPDSTR